MLKNEEIMPIVVIGIGDVPELRQIISPQVKQIQGERSSSRAYLYGATLKKVRIFSSIR